MMFRPLLCADGLRGCGAVLSLCALLFSPTPSHGQGNVELPLEPISAVRRDADGDFMPDRLQERVRVRGILTSIPGMLDARGRVGVLADRGVAIGLYLRDQTLAEFQPGDVLEVVGTIGTYKGAEQIHVERAIQIGRRPTPEPLLVTPDALKGEDLSGRLVRVRGELVVSPDEPVYQRFAIVSGEERIPLYIPDPIASAPEFPLKIEDAGRRVEVVGFAGQYDWKPPFDRGYRLVPRSGADLHLLGISMAAVRGGVGAVVVLLLALALLVYLRRARSYQRQSYTDPMTGLLNKRGYEERLEREMDESRKTGTPLALVMLDLDDFKRVNDEHGHLAGDALLRAVANSLQGAVREVDAVCRYAGDEFALIFPGLHGDLTLEVVNRIIRGLDSVVVEMEREPLVLPLGLSAGVAVYDGREETTARDLFQAADTALYQSKRAGKGQARIALKAS